MRLIIPMIIQTILLDPSGAIWTDGPPNVRSLDPSGAVQVDAEHPTRNRKGARKVSRGPLGDHGGHRRSSGGMMTAVPKMQLGG
jgi:hypothetical protein